MYESLDQVYKKLLKSGLRLKYNSNSKETFTELVIYYFRFLQKKTV